MSLPELALGVHTVYKWPEDHTLGAGPVLPLIKNISAPDKGIERNMHDTSQGIGEVLQSASGENTIYSYAGDGESSLYIRQCIRIQQ